MKNIEQNNWTYFIFEPISNCQNKGITVELALDSKGLKKYVGVFEDNRKRTLLSKFCDKLRIPTRKTDILYVDYK